MRTFSCSVIGKGVVALECLKILEQAGHSVISIYSVDQSLQPWATERAIPHSHSRQDFQDLLYASQYDYLFSINNGWIIPPDVIARSRKATINYHNSPLPKYAGLHAASWALLQGETQHAIVWHEVVPEIDAGCILKYQSVPIEAEDTALSLNTRCFEAAIAAFAQLVIELADDRVQRLPQDLSQRSYFGLTDRPEAAGILTFDTSAQSICNLVHALDFEPILNPLGLPKLRLPNGVIAVRQARLEMKSGVPGQVLEADDSGSGARLCVATADGAVELSRLTTLAGHPLSRHDLREQYGVQLGAVLPVLTQSQRQAIGDRNAAICRYESRWVQRLAHFNPFVHPYLSEANLSEANLSKAKRCISSQVFHVAILVDTPSPSGQIAAWQDRPWHRSLLALFAAYCARLAPEPAFDLSLQTDAQRSVAPELFAQTVPIRIQTKVDEPLSHFCERFDAALSQAEDWGSYALDIVARYPELRDRTLGAAIGKDVAARSKLPSTLMAIPSEACMVIASSPAQLNFDSLSAAIAFVAYTDGSSPELVHRGALSEAEAQAIVGQLQCLICASVKNPEQLVSALPLLSVREQQLLSDWNQTSAPYPDDYCIHELITQQAIRTPDAIAVQASEGIAVGFGDQQLSYQDLDRRSDHLARCLSQLGIQTDTLVALCVPRSVDLIVGLLGILKAGGAYIPIDPTYPRDRIAYLLDDSAPQAIVTVRSLEGLFESHPSVFCLDDLDVLSAKGASAEGHGAERNSLGTELGNGQPISPKVTPENLAYVIYTSGSTGKPKGVEIQHRSVVNHSWAIANLYDIRSDDIRSGDGACGASQDRILQSASISFDVAAEQIYPALFRGGTVVIRPDDLLESFDRFSSFVKSQAITILVLPTAFWHEWTVQLFTSGETVPPRLRVLGVGTEKVLSHRLEQWQTLSEGRVAFFQGYGPTEATVTCTMYHHARSLARAAVPIGRPLPNTEIYILDRELQPVPIGVVGELYIGGDSLARGYHGQPTLTAQRFIRHPFRSDARLYRTGDFARFEWDGQIVYCDRVDDQIKLNGFRIELGEIEAAFNQHPGVKQAVVRPYQKAGLRRLVAYVVPGDQNDLSLEDLKQTVQQILPSYMLPSAIVVMNALPLLPTGKVDYRSLPEPTSTQPTASVPCTPLEQQLIEIWKTVLGIEHLSTTDSFFELGGHSLIALRLLQQIEQACHQKVPLMTFLKAPTIQHLALYLQSDDKASSRDAGVEGIIPIQPQGSKPPLFAIHVLGKGLKYYRPLSKHLGTDQPLYGLAAHLSHEGDAVPGSEGASVQLDVNLLAAYYVERLHAMQPQGPYHLLGISFGGMVAFEMARQLRSRGEAVALLGLLDTAAPFECTEQLPRASRLAAYWTHALHIKPTAAIAKIKNQLVERSLQYPALEAGWRWLYQTLDRAFPDAMQETLYIQQSQRAASRYTPQMYPGRITLFQASDQIISMTAAGDPRLGWKKLAAEGVQIYHIPGDHLGMLQEPHVQILAQQLQQHLNDQSVN